MTDIKKTESSLLAGQVTVSELSDELCRILLRRILKRHNKVLAELEERLRQDEASMHKLEVVKCSTTSTTPKELNSEA